MTLRRVFYGESELRAGWRFAIFAAIIALLFTGRGAIESWMFAGLDDASRFVINQASRFVLCLFASWIMAKIEKRTIADYGLPWRRMFRNEFWLGSIFGFAALTMLLGVMHLIGVFDFGKIALHGAEIWRWGAIYAVLFLIVGLSEEFFFRGYVQFTLATGIGFWPAAILMNALFGFLHRTNHGETWAGLVNAGLGGLFFCLLLRKSGNLWMPIGFHAAWDWGESYFFGVPDSGIVTPGHLLQSAFSGSARLTGGTVGPEGSWLCTLLFIVLGAMVMLLMKRRMTPASPPS